MDRLIERFDATPDDDLMVCAHRGVAYQRNMRRGRVAYDAKYLAVYDAYAANAVSQVLNAARVQMVARHAAAGARVLDVGAAAGVFVRAARSAGFRAKGFDVIPEAVARLRASSLYADDPSEFDALTLWDSLEHMDDPGAFVSRAAPKSLVCVAVPIFDDLARVRESKHFKPGEHLYYWTRSGFVSWMALYGFRLLEESFHEVEAGRESIGAFAFVRDLPTWRDYVAAYSEMHSSRHYGSSATELHLDTAAGVVRSLNPTSIIDYGCGRSDLVAHFWRDGERRIARFDPAIPAFKRLPEGRFDLAFVCDVMEHIPMNAVDRVLEEIKSKAPVAFFTISTKLARAKLPDGSNAHVTLLTPSEWARWIRRAFGDHLKTLPSRWEHELLFLAGKAPEKRAA